MSQKIKVIIAGGREFKDYRLLKQSCDYYFHRAKDEGIDIEIVSGKARGADTLGEQYAKENGYDIKPFPADWNQHGYAAGPIRNGEMARYATHLIAFWDGKSTGTANMIDQARKNGLRVRVVRYND